MTQKANNTIRIPAPTDQQALHLFEAIVAEYDGLQFSASLGGASLGNFRNSEQFIKQYPKEDWNRTRSISHLQASLPAANNANVPVFVAFHRNITTFHHPQNEVVPDTWENEIWFYGQSDQRIPPDVALKLMSLIDAYRLETDPKSEAGKSREVTKLFARQMADLASLQRQIVVEAEQARHQREAEYQQRLHAFEEEAAARRAEDATLYKIEQVELQKERERLAAREREIDDRSHMHARREMRERITKDLRDRLTRPSVSNEAKETRRSILITCFGLIILFAAATIYSAVELALLTNASAAADLKFYLAIGRFTASLGATAAVGFYLLGWLRRVHDEDVRSERDLERYLYDVDRASWAIDTILEAQARDTAGEQVAIPIEWIQGATHGLFARTEPKDENQAASEALGTLLNFAAEAKFGPGGPEFKITKRGLAQARKSGLLTDDT